MYRQEHINNTAKKFGGMSIALEYTWVHDWMDHIARSGVSLLKHRQYRHHEKALQNEFVPYAKKNHPEADIELALQIAREHIIDDMGLVPDSEIDFI